MQVQWFLHLGPHFLQGFYLLSKWYLLIKLHFKTWVCVSLCVIMSDPHPSHMLLSHFKWIKQFVVTIKKKYKCTAQLYGQISFLPVLRVFSKSRVNIRVSRSVGCFTLAYIDTRQREMLLVTEWLMLAPISKLLEAATQQNTRSCLYGNKQLTDLMN